MLKKITLNEILKILIIFIIIIVSIITSKYIGLLDLFYKLIKSLLPIFLAIGISFLNEPLIKKIEKYIKRKYAVIILYIYELIICILIITLVIPSFMTQLEKFIDEIPKLYEFIMEKIKTLNLNLDINNTLSTYSKELIKTFSNLIGIIIDIAIAYVGAFFLSFDYQKFKFKIKEFLEKKNKNKIIIYIKNFNPYIYKYIYCLLIDMVVLWLITGISFLLAGLEYPFMFGLIIAISDLIPFIGPLIGGTPAVLVALTVSLKFAIFILIIIVIAQFIESNITKPYIMKNAIKLHPLEGLIGISIGGTLFGFLGLILSPIIITGIKIYIDLKKEEKI